MTAANYPDHYAVTLLPNLRRAQVGPMALQSAKAMVADLKTQHHHVATNSWVDWRRLEQWPLLSPDQYRAEVGAAITPKTLPLGHLSDRILIEEIKRRGYVVPKKDYVLDLTCQNPYEVWEFDAMAENSAWMESAHRTLARRLGERLWQAGAFQVSTVESVFGQPMKALCMNVIAVAPEPR